MSLAQALLLPLLLHMLLTMGIGVLTLRSRIAAIKSRKVRLADVAVDNSRWPEEVRKFSNNFDNQFQVPVFAYAVGALIIATGLADVPSVALIWVFLAARIFHSVEHVGRNDVRRRLTWFLISFVAIVALWLWFSLRFLVIG